jgi:hypothetical protein
MGRCGRAQLPEAVLPGHRTLEAAPAATGHFGRPIRLEFAMEHWKWQVPTVAQGRFSTQGVPDEELRDYRRIQNGFRQYWD